MCRRPPRSTRTVTLFPYTTHFRSRFNLNGSYLDTYRKKDFSAEPYGDNLVGKYEPYLNLPLEWKHTLSFGWSKGAFTHTLTQVYRDGYEDYLPPGMRNGTYVPPNYDPDVDAYITYNYSLRSEEHTSELQSLMRISSAVFCLTKTTKNCMPKSVTK